LYGANSNAIMDGVFCSRPYILLYIYVYTRRWVQRFRLVGFSGANKNPAGCCWRVNTARGRPHKWSSSHGPSLSILICICVCVCVCPARSLYMITLSVPRRRSRRRYRCRAYSGTPVVEKKIAHNSCENNIRFGFSPPSNNTPLHCSCTCTLTMYII